MQETKYLFALFRFQCWPHYVNEPDNEISCQRVNVLVFFKFFIIINCFFVDTIITYM